MSGELILVVDDEPHIVELAKLYLEREGFRLTSAGDGATALSVAARETPALMVLDLMLPALDGYEVCRRVRAGAGGVSPDLPILMLTARDEDVDKIVGLELGADDYLTKPFNPRELVARVKAILRRSERGERPAGAEAAGRPLHVGDVVIDPARREVSVKGKPATLRAKEFDLLQALAEHRGLVLTREQLLSLVWGFDFPGVEFQRSGSNYQLRAGIRNDSSTWTNSSWFTISDAPHYIEVDWKASTGVGANNGYLKFWVDDVQKSNTTGVDNDTRRIDHVRLGAVAGVDDGTRGTYYFDAFQSGRAAFIGPATTGLGGSRVLARPALGFAEEPALQVGGVVTTTITYEYDPLYRLTGADYSDGSYFEYSYDEVGNRLTQTSCLGGTGCTPVTTSYVYDDANRLTTVNGITYTWDNNGNLLNDGLSTYEYNAANRLVEATGQSIVSSYQYNGLGDRWQQTVDSVATDYTLDINTGLTQILTDGTNTYLYGLRRVGEQQPSGFTYHLPDAIGSVRQLVDATTMITLATSYEPFGGLLTSTGTGNSIFQFTGEQRDLSGLTFLRARYLATSVGRFISRDTWPGDMQIPLSLNRWNYSLSDPVNNIDPSGRCARRAGEIIAANGLPGFLNAAEYCIDWFSGAAQGYEGSGWGYGPRQWVARQLLCLNGDANNLAVLAMLSLLQFDSVRVTGQALAKIKQDPAMIAFENDIVSLIRINPLFGERSFYERIDARQIGFGGSRSPGSMTTQAFDPFDGLWRNRDETIKYFTIHGLGSTDDILDPTKNPLHLTYIETWRVAFNELTWFTRNVYIRALVKVESKGRIRIHYSFTDTLDLRPEANRSSAYNAVTTILGPLYHDFLGGNDQLRVNATWYSDR